MMAEAAILNQLLMSHPAPEMEHAISTPFWYKISNYYPCRQWIQLHCLGGLRHEPVVVNGR